MTELAHRRNHDFDVALYWDTSHNELFVVVEDIGAGDRFSIAARRGSHARCLSSPLRLRGARLGPDRSSRRKETEMNETATYSVPRISCSHRRAAITAEVTAVAGVDSVELDPETDLRLGGALAALARLSR